MDQQQLWAPWRIAYIKGLADADAPTGGGGGSGRDGGGGGGGSGGGGGCFLCDAARAGLDDAERRDRLVLLRDDRGVLLLNRYPYTNGHILAAPAEHVPSLTDMTAAQRAGLIELCELATRLLETAMNPQGVNLGMNIGRCAGAGLPGHAHMHIVPRWNGDVNFMHVIGHVRVIPEALESSYAALSEALAAER
ncbi:MAG: HIT domain-containing protein [Phycisphaeraceae bacterium]